MNNGWTSVGLKNLTKFSQEYNRIPKIATSSRSIENKGSVEGSDKPSSSSSSTDSDSTVDVTHVQELAYDDHDDLEEEVSWSTFVSYMPWFVPENYEVLLQNHQLRKYNLKLHQRLFILLTDSSSCIVAQLYGYMMFGVIVLSVVIVIASTMPNYHTVPENCASPVCDNEDLCPGEVVCPPSAAPVFTDIDTAIIAVYSLDFVLRFCLVGTMDTRLTGICSPNWDEVEFKVAQQKNRAIRKEPNLPIYKVYLKFIFSTGTLIDVISIFPFYLTIAIPNFGEGRINSTASFIRILRVFRIFRGTWIKEDMFGILHRAMVDSIDALMIMGLLLLLAAIVCGCVIFAAEAGTFRITEEFPEGAFFRWNDVLKTFENSPSPFDSIPTCMYLGVMTLTTVGYGDIYPITKTGRFIACVSAIIGVLCVSLPVSVISTNFAKEYESTIKSKEAHAKARKERLLKKYRKQLKNLNVIKTIKSSRRLGMAQQESNEWDAKQKQEIQDMFKLFCQDNSDTIGLKQLHLALASLGQLNITNFRLKKVIESEDADFNGRIDLQEFENILLRLTKMGAFEDGNSSNASKSRKNVFLGDDSSTDGEDSFGEIVSDASDPEQGDGSGGHGGNGTGAKGGDVVIANSATSHHHHHHHSHHGSHSDLEKEIVSYYRLDVNDSFSPDSYHPRHHPHHHHNHRHNGNRALSTRDMHRYQSSRQVEPRALSAKSMSIRHRHHSSDELHDRHLRPSKSRRALSDAAIAALDETTPLTTSKAVANYVPGQPLTLTMCSHSQLLEFTNRLIAAHQDLEQLKLIIQRGPHSQFPCEESDKLTEAIVEPADASLYVRDSNVKLKLDLNSPIEFVPQSLSGSSDINSVNAVEEAMFQSTSDDQSAYLPGKEMAISTDSFDSGKDRYVNNSINTDPSPPNSSGKSPKQRSPGRGVHFVDNQSTENNSQGRVFFEVEANDNSSELNSYIAK